jgi:Flp pilus assembly protein TadD
MERITLEKRSGRWLVLVVAGFLSLAIWLVFSQVVGHEFVNYDDDVYVYENSIVLRGLTGRGLQWAFTHSYAFNWHPLTWISHMGDVQLYGLWAGGHHLTNVILHAWASVLLFLVMREMTGALWRSAFVAALFAVHPLHVESVAWVSERKDVLSGVFFMLTLGAYVRQVRKPSWSRYVLVTILFCLGLMSKPSLVTLPFLLLLLDYWPLGRFPFPRFPGKLIIEKIPLLVLGMASCGATLWAQQKAIVATEALPMQVRVANAIVTYVVYVGQMLIPIDLVVFYPFPLAGIPLLKIVLALILLVGLSVGAWWGRRLYPWLLTGWYWYVGMLVPMIGLIQVGAQAQADRYTYLSQIGLYLVLIWAMAEVVERRGWSRKLVAGVAALILAGLMGLAGKQTSYWQNSESLWRHALACNPRNATAHYSLGHALILQGQPDEAIPHLRRALEIRPQYATAHINLGIALAQKGQREEAMLHHRKAVELLPEDADARNNLGWAFYELGRLDEGIIQLEKAMALKPENARIQGNLGEVLIKVGRLDEARIRYQNALELEPGNAEYASGLGLALLKKGRTEEAINYLKKAVEIRPDDPMIRVNLGLALTRDGQANEAIFQYEKAMELPPSSPTPFNNLAWILATNPKVKIRNGPRAVELALRANQMLASPDAGQLDTLAAAYAEAGRFPEAVTTARRAIDLAVEHADNTLTEDLRVKMALYQARKPYRTVSERKRE